MPRLSWMVLAFSLVFSGPRQAWAVPSFARQTGMDCSACHTVFPELNAFGRQFKLTGYNVGSVSWITASDAQGNTRVKLSPFPPLAGMFMAGQQFTAKNPNPVSPTVAGADGGGSNSFPSQFSLFYAGALSPNMGAFIQATYDSSSGVFHFDNSDIRYTGRTDVLGTDLIYGVSINNNPTVQDVWNSTPAWGFPYASPSGSLVVSPQGGTQIEGLGGAVASLGAYAYWNDWVYAEGSIYRSADPLGSSYAIQGAAPYWRVAVQNDWDDHAAEIGTFGMAANTYPASAPNGFTQDNFTDFGVDSQYQYVGDDHLLTLKGSWIQESQSWNVSAANALASQSYGKIHRLKMDATYYYHRLLGASAGYFSVDANQDNTLYQQGVAVNGSQSGVPNSNGMVYELNYLPWYNTKFSLQYTAYNEFNGGTGNYDGNGRNAWDNNVFMIQGWFLY